MFQVVYYTENYNSFNENKYIWSSNKSHQQMILDDIYKFIEENNYDCLETANLFKQNKTLKEIINDETFIDGYFIIKDADVYTLYKKYQIVHNNGIIFNNIIKESKYDPIRYYSHVDNIVQQFSSHIFHKYTNILKENPNLLYIDHKNSQQLVNKILMESVYNVQYVPSKYLDQHICNELFYKNFNVYKYLPKEFITIQMVETISSTPNFYSYEIFDEHLNDIVIDNLINNGFTNTIKFNKNLLTYKQWIKYCQINGFKVFRYIPKKFQDKNMLKTSLTNYVKRDINFDDIPLELLDNEICELLISINGSLLNKIPYNLKTKKMYQQAYINVPSIKIPLEYLNDDIYVAMIKKNPIINYINKIPEHLLTKELWEDLLSNNSHLSSNVPKKFLSSTFYENVITKGDFPIRIIPRIYMNNKICDLAISKNKHQLNNIPTEFKTVELFLKYYKLYPEEISNILSVGIPLKIFPQILEKLDYDKEKYINILDNL